MTEANTPRKNSPAESHRASIATVPASDTGDGKWDGGPLTTSRASKLGLLAKYGVAPRCYHRAMPTRFLRIPVTKDHALSEALGRVAPFLEPDQPAASLVHDLAIRGAEALLAERQQDAEGIERLIERSTSADPGFDVDIAQRIDELAWGK